MENQASVDNQVNHQAESNPPNQPEKVSEKPRLNPWIIASAGLFVVLITVGFYTLGLKKDTSPSNTPAAEKKASKSGSQENDLSKTYTNPKYPDFKILYNSSWSLNSTESQVAYPPGATNSLVTLEKNGTSLFFDIKVAGAPMGWVTSCFSKSERPYTIVSQNLLERDLIRYKDSAYGNFYWFGAIVKERDEKQFSEKLASYDGSCKKDDSCALCNFTVAEETMTVSTTYPLPDDGINYGPNKYYGALVNVYVKQNNENQTLLKEADQIVQESIKESLSSSSKQLD
jgi:hypothetical protein